MLLADAVLGHSEPQVISTVCWFVLYIVILFEPTLVK